MSAQTSRCGDECFVFRGSLIHRETTEPHLYSCAWKTLGLIDPAATPHFLASSSTWGTSFSPLGRSQMACRATVGHAPVNWLTMPASLNFSARLVAAAGWVNLPNRVPVLANP